MVGSGTVTMQEQREIILRVEACMEDMRQGRMVILVDDEDRENEGDLVMAAEKATPEAINFMARYGRGLICLSLSGERCDQLGLPLMVSQNRSAFGTAFTVSIEAARGVTTGISAADRAQTILAAVAPHAKPSDLASPGHIFPLRARDGGVLVRTGQTEGSVDLMRLAGLEPAGVICEIMNDDGTMSRRPQLEVFAAEHQMRILSVADLIYYRLLRERLVERAAEFDVHLDGIGDFHAITYRTAIDRLEHLALVKGEPSPQKPVLSRVHRASALEDLFGCGTRQRRYKLEWALKKMEQEGLGIFVYLQQNNHNLLDLHEISCSEKSCAATDRGAVGLPVELCEFGIGAQILLDLGARDIRLLTTTAARIKGIEGYGLRVIEHVAMPPREETK